MGQRERAGGLRSCPTSSRVGADSDAGGTCGVVEAMKGTGRWPSLALSNAQNFCLVSHGECHTHDHEGSERVARPAGSASSVPNPA